MIYPSDCKTAYEAWGANCGPCALAAILEKQVSEVRALLDGFDARRYMNPTHMKAALDKAGVHYHAVGANRPERGLIFVQWGGHEKKPIGVQYRFTHWIAVKRRDDGVLTTFEVNVPHLVDFEEWKTLMPEWMAEEKRGDGTFFIRSGLAVQS